MVNSNTECKNFNTRISHFYKAHLFEEPLLKISKLLLYTN